MLMTSICQWGVARALFTKCIDESEVQSVFSAIAFLSGLMPIASNPAFRQLYDRTLDTFPGAFLIMSAAIGLVLAVANFYLYTHRGNMLVDRKGELVKNDDDAEKEQEEDAERRQSGISDVKADESERTSSSSSS